MPGPRDAWASDEVTPTLCACGVPSPEEGRGRASLLPLYPLVPVLLAGRSLKWLGQMETIPDFGVGGSNVRSTF